MVVFQTQAISPESITFPDFHEWLMQKMHVAGEPQLSPDDEVIEALKKLSEAIVVALRRNTKTWIEGMSYHLGYSIATGHIGPDDLGRLVKNKPTA